MKSKQKTIGISPLDFYLSYNSKDKKSESENIKVDLAEPLEEKKEELVKKSNQIDAKDSESIDASNITNNLSQQMKVEQPSEPIVKELLESNTQESKRDSNILTSNYAEENNLDATNIISQAELDSTLKLKPAQQELKQYLESNVDTEEYKIKKERVTIHIPTELIDKVKNAVYWEPGLTLAGFAQIAFDRFLSQLEEEKGEPFPPRRRHRLFGGRPIK
jgi:predicted DNA binding CopG/RHH family protein